MLWLQAMAGAAWVGGQITVATLVPALAAA